MYYGAYLIHHGIKGQKWGIRRYQNVDGTLTAAGKKRYLSDVEVSANTTDYLWDKEIKRSISISKHRNKWGIGQTASLPQAGRHVLYKSAANQRKKSYEKTRQLIKDGLENISKLNASDEEINRLFDIGTKFLYEHDFKDVSSVLSGKNENYSESYLDSLVKSHLNMLEEDRKRYGYGDD